jgi:quinolinate synthase
MMNYVKSTKAPYYLMLTECGLVGRLEVEAPEKNFIGGCRLCPYMKMNTLEKVRDALRGLFQSSLLARRARADQG